MSAVHLFSGFCFTATDSVRAASSGVFVHVNEIDQFRGRPFCFAQSEGTQDIILCILLLCLCMKENFFLRVVVVLHKYLSQKTYRQVLKKKAEISVFVYLLSCM